MHKITPTTPIHTHRMHETMKFKQFSLAQCKPIDNKFSPNFNHNSNVFCATNGKNVFYICFVIIGFNSFTNINISLNKLSNSDPNEVKKCAVQYYGNRINLFRINEVKELDARLSHDNNNDNNNG